MTLNSFSFNMELATSSASLQRGDILTHNKCPRYNNKQSDGEASLLEL